MPHKSSLHATRLSQQLSIEIIHEIHSSSYARFASVPRDTCRTDEGSSGGCGVEWSVWAWQHVLPLNCQTTESKKKLTFAQSVHPALFSLHQLSLCVALASLRFRTNHNSIVSTCQSQDMGLHLSSVTLALYNHLWSRLTHFPPSPSLSLSLRAQQSS